MHTQGPMPRYERIKRHVISQIKSGIWQPGDRVPSENTLVSELGVSRMTVNRAFRELSQEGHLVRVQGTGTFVAEQKPPVDILQLRNIAEEIIESGHVYTSSVEYLKIEQASPEIAEELGLRSGDTVYHSILTHISDERPVQVEDRFVNPLMAPDYMTVDFKIVTPNSHLMKVAPLSEVEHIIEAIMPDSKTQKLLNIPENEPCLQLRRRTWSQSNKGMQVVSTARLIHPGNSHSFGTRFTYETTGKGTGVPI